MSRFAITLAFVSLFQATASAQSIDTMALRAHTRFLASDLLEGRGTGTRGEHLAAQYIAAQLTRIGAEPLTGNDFLLPVPLKRVLIDNNTTTARIGTATYTNARDFVWNTGGRNAFRSFTGPLMYVGEADSLALQRTGNYRGNVLVMSGAMGAAAAQFIPAAIAAGATGVVLLIPDSNTFALYVRSRGDSRYYVDAAVDDPVWQADLPVLIAGPGITHLLRGTDVPARFAPLNKTIDVRFNGTVQDVRSANVAGVLRGADPKLATEYVAFSAHYDHLGISVPDASGDSIYNGFSDDAAGVAMVLTAGEALAKERPARSVLMLFFTGEERGLLGSTAFAASSPVPLSSIRGLINLDAGAPPAPPVSWRIAGGTMTELGTIAKTALEARQWRADLGGATPNSDYWPFLMQGVNAIFIIPGSQWENVTEQQQQALRARWDHYHAANDHWSADFPFSGIARYAEAALAVAREIAR